MIDLKIIKLLCNEAGITLKKLSDKTKISQTAITMAIQRNSTTLETLEKIANFFHVSVGVFFGEKDIFAPLRKSFESFDKDVKSAANYVITTLQYYAPDVQNIVTKGFIIEVFEKLSPEVVKIIEYASNKVTENPVFVYLMQFSIDELLKMKSDGILSKDVVDMILVYKNIEFFGNNEFLVDLKGDGEPNFWEELKRVTAEYNRRLNNKAVHNQ